MKQFTLVRQWYIVILECVWYGDLSFHIEHALTSGEAIRKAKGKFLPDSTYIHTVWLCGETKPEQMSTIGWR